MSSKQLYRLITESDSLKLCEATGNKGNVSLTAKYLQEDPSRAAEIEQRILKECQARAKLRDVAKRFEVCTTLTEKEACDSKSDLCEWEAQDEKLCGIDEEKLVVAVVGDTLKTHPLIENVIVQDKCSAMNHEKCNKDAKCAWMHEKDSCMANPALLFNAFIEHPALFVVVDSQEQAAVCGSFTENVWHGRYCWEDRCHWEHGICTANKDISTPNVSTVMKMKDHMCRDGHHGVGGSYTAENAVVRCPPGCKEDLKDGSCKAEPIDETKSLTLTEDDKEVAMYFRILRSATYIQESRCNSLDDDEIQCRNVQSKHIDCPPGYFDPGKNWTGYGRGRWNRQRSDASPTPAPAPEAQAKEDMKNIVGHMSRPDGGIGFQEKLGEMLQMVQTNQGAFAEQFQSFIAAPETQGQLQLLQEQAPQYIKGMHDFIQSMAPPTPAPTMPPPPPPVEHEHKDDSLFGGSSHMVMICIASLLFAGVCGGFAWGVVCSNRMGDNRVELLETQYIRQEEMMRQGRV